MRETLPKEDCTKEASRIIQGALTNCIEQKIKLSLNQKGKLSYEGRVHEAFAACILLMNYMAFFNSRAIIIYTTIRSMISGSFLYIMNWLLENVIYCFAWVKSIL